MSQDEEDAIIGRMVRERKQLEKSNAVLHEEIHRIGVGLQQLARDLTNDYYGSTRNAEQNRVGANWMRTKLQSLLSERNHNNKRLDQLRDALSKI